jgi:hypothetical protein
MKEIAKLVGVSLSSVSCWVRDVPLTEEPACSVARARPCRQWAFEGFAGKQHPSSFTSSCLSAGWAGSGAAEPSDACGRDACCSGPKAHGNGTVFSSRTQIQRWSATSLISYGPTTPFPQRTSASTATSSQTISSVSGRSSTFWLEILELPASCLRKSTVNVYSKHSQKKRRNELRYGTVRVCVHSTQVVQSIYGSIQEYGGFERPEWLG